MEDPHDFSQITESSNTAKAWKGSGHVCQVEFGISRAGSGAPSPQPQIYSCLPLAPSLLLPCSAHPGLLCCMPGVSLALGAGFLPTSLLGKDSLDSSLPRE